MPIVRPDQSSGGGGGSGLPSQWTVDSHGAVTITTDDGSIPLKVKSSDPAVGTALFQLLDSTGTIVTDFDNDGGGGLSNQHILFAQRGPFTVDIDAAEAGGNPIYQLKKGGDQIVRVAPGGGISTIISPNVATDIALAIAAFTSQTADLLVIYNDNFDPVFTISPAGKVTAKGAALNPLASGALPTVSPSSGTAFQCSTSRDVFLLVPVTYNPGVATTATCQVELSPDNVTFSTLITITQPVGTVFDGSIEPVTLSVPAAWYVKLTTTNATLGTGTYY